MNDSILTQLTKSQEEQACFAKATFPEKTRSEAKQTWQATYGQLYCEKS
jgi:hypothetical protein